MPNSIDDFFVGEKVIVLAKSYDMEQSIGSKSTIGTVTQIDKHFGDLCIQLNTTNGEVYWWFYPNSLSKLEVLN